METRHAHADPTRCSNEIHHRHHLFPNPSRSHRKRKKPAKTKDRKENFLWKDDNVYYLCNKWQEEPVLYDIKNKYYYDKTKRGLAVDRIWDGMSAMEFNPLSSKENIVEKMNGLRTYYNSQRQKVESSQESGTDTESVYKVKWQFYSSLHFLKDNVTPRRTLSNMDGDEENPPKYRE